MRGSEDPFATRRRGSEVKPSFGVALAFLGVIINLGSMHFNDYEQCLLSS